MLRTFMIAVAVVALGTVSDAQKTKPAAQETLAPITVYRTPTCGCCGKWVEHLKAAGFTVTDHIVRSLDKAPGRQRVPDQLRSCHTAFIGRYVVEGHIPANVVKDLVRKRPNVDGIAVPGMPAGSPGMESPYPVTYDVIAFDTKGTTSTFARIVPPR